MLMTIQMQNNFLFLKRKIWLFFVLCYQLSATYSQSNIDDLLQKGNQGDSIAQFDLGMFYLNGTKETPIDYKKAILWLEKSPINKNSQVQFNIGKIYYDGKLGRRDYNTAFLWFKKSGDQDYPKALFQIAQMYNLGEGTSYNVKMAYKFFKRGAELNDTLSIFWLGICYQSGSGVKENQKEAFNLFEKAASLGLVEAEYKLAEMYESGVYEVLEKNCEKAIEKYTLCARSGDRVAQFYLGKLYRSGLCDLKIDYNAALEWFEMCLTNNNGVDLEYAAAFETGRIYFLGNGVKKDKIKAAKLIKIAVNRGHIEATKFWNEHSLQDYYKPD